MSEGQGARVGLEDLPGKSLAARLRPMMADIERRVREGVKHEVIVEHLCADGIEIELGTFRKTLYRFRRRTRSEATQSVPIRTDEARDEQVGTGGMSTLLKPQAGESAEAEPTALSTAERVALALDPARRNAAAEQYMKPKTRPRLGSLNKG